MARFTLDPNNLPQLSAAQIARVDALTDAELERLSGARRVREVRAHTGLSQANFAQTFHINVSRLRDLEQGRTQPDSAVLAYLAVIDKEPDAVRRALDAAD